VSQWTVDTLKEYVDKRIEGCSVHTNDKFEAQAEATTQALHSAEKATEKAERLADVRAEVQDRLAAETKRQQNEWRAALGDMTATYMTLAQYTSAHQVLVEKIQSLEHRHDIDLTIVREAIGVKTGRQLGQGQLVIWLFLAVASLVSILGIILDLTVRH